MLLWAVFLRRSHISVFDHECMFHIALRAPLRLCRAFAIWFRMAFQPPVVTLLSAGQRGAEASFVRTAQLCGEEEKRRSRGSSPDGKPSAVMCRGWVVRWISASLETLKKIVRTKRQTLTGYWLFFSFWKTNTSKSEIVLNSFFFFWNKDLL